MTRDYHELWRWSVTSSRRSGRRSGSSSTFAPPTPYERVLGSRAMPGAEWFPGARLNYAEHAFRGRDPERRRGPARVGASPLGRDDLGRARRADAPMRRRRSAPRASAPATASSRTSRTSSRRVVALPCLREPRRDLVELLARLRRPQRRRPLRADRAAGAPRRRRVSLRRPRPRPARRRPRAPGRRCRPLERTVVLGYLDPEPVARRAALGDVAGTTSSPRAATSALDVRAGAVRPSALGAVQLGDDRAAEGDRARARRASSSSC